MGTLHDFVSMHVVHPAYRLYRSARPGHRRAMRFFDDGIRFRHHALDWNEEARRAWILDRLRRAVRRAAAESPFWAERFREAGFDARSDFGFAQLAALPVLEREDVREAGTSILSSRLDPAERRRDSTGGSTGVPTQIFTGPEERGWRESGIASFMHRVGIRRGMRVAYLWGHHLDPVQRDTARKRAQDWLNNVRWFDCMRLSPERLMRYHETLDEWRPACIIARSSTRAGSGRATRRWRW
jgi:phenylacetate-coenzyme A ligase PaaK-like adenylate-forming protein